MESARSSQTGGSDPSRAGAAGTQTLRDDARWVIALVLATAAIYLMLAIDSIFALVRFEGARIPEFVIYALRIGGLVQIPLYIAGGIAWVVWHRHTNLRQRATGREGLRFSPGWSAGWYFVPYANLVMVPKLMQETWRASDPAAGPTGWKSSSGAPLVYAWWGLFVLGNLVSGIGLGGALGGERATYLVANALGMLLVAAAGAAAIVLIRRIEGRMTALKWDVTPASAVTRETEPVAPPQVMPEPVVTAFEPEAAPSAPPEPTISAPLGTGGEPVYDMPTGPVKEQEAAEGIRSMRDPRLMRCPSCGVLSVPTSARSAILSAIGLLLVVPFTVVIGTAVFGAETMHDNAPFLAIAAVASIGWAWQTAKGAWVKMCPACNKPGLVPLSDEERAARIANVESRIVRDGSQENKEGGA